MGYGTYIGRVGALAVALGVGFAVASPAGIASADTASATDTASSSADTDTGSTDSASTSAGAEPGGAGSDATRTDADDDADEPSSPTAEDDVADLDDDLPDVDEDVEDAPDIEDDTEKSEAEKPVAAKPAKKSDKSGPAAEPEPAAEPATQTTPETTAKPTAKVSEKAATAPAPATAVATPATEKSAEKATAPITLSATTTQQPVAAATPVNIVGALVKAVVSPIVSSILAALPGDPAGSPLGWMLLAAARREVGVPTEPTASTEAVMRMAVAAVAGQTDTVADINAADAYKVVVNGTRAYVTNKAAGTVTIVDTATNSIVKTVAAGMNPDGIAVKPDGAQIYVTSSQNNTITVVNTATGATARTISLTNPTAIGISPSGQTLYVTSGSTGKLVKITTVFWNSASVNLPAGSTPIGLVVSPDISNIYVISQTATGGNVSSVGAAAYTSNLIASFASAPTALTISPNSARLYVSTADSKLTVIDTASKAVVARHTLSATPASVAVSPDGVKVYVTDTAGVVSALDAATGALLNTFVSRSSTTPMTVRTSTAVSADGTKLYITDYDADVVHVVSLVATNTAPAVGTPVVSAPDSGTGAVTGQIVASDPDGDPLQYTVTGAPARGSVTLAGDGTFTYTPTAAARHAAAQLGAPQAVDTFTVSVDDGNGGVATTTVTVSIAPSNAAPTSQAVTSSTDPNTGVVTGTVTFTDADGDTLTYTASPAGKGALTMHPDGSFTYTPSEAARQAAAAPGAGPEAKTDIVTVTVTDGYGGSATMTLTLTVTPAVSAPAAGYEANDPTMAIGAVIGTVNPADPNAAGLTYTVTAGPAKGQVRIDSATGNFTYVPDLDARYAAAATSGVDTDTFTVTVTDALGATTTVAVTVQVAPPLESAMDQRSTTIAVTAQEMYFFTQAETDLALDMLKAAGVTNIRILVPWMGVEPIDDTWSWAAVDRMVNGAYARDIEVLAVLNSPPIWASVPNVPLLAGRPASVAEFAEYAAMVATRYAGKISAYEIWNEQNYWGFWAPGPNAAEYTELLKAAYPAIKAADPDAVVLVGGLAPVLDFFNITANPVRFVQEMYAAGAAGYFDAIAFHPYLYGAKFSVGANTWQTPRWQLNQIYALMVANGDGNKKIWATEYGQPSHLVSEQSQADFIADFLRTWRTLSYAGPAFIQTIKDNTETDENAANMGLLRADWTPKPAFGVVSDIIAENQALLT
ncbi:Ig-like domain-containing protein [Mycolicibacterium phlei]